MFKFVLSLIVLLPLFTPQTLLAQNNTGYVHMDPSGKGFIYDNGDKFIPNGYGAGKLWKRYWLDNPTTGTESVYYLGATQKQASCAANVCGAGCPASTQSQTWDQWFAEIAGFGVNSIRVQFGGGTDSWSPGMFPYAIGKYNVADVPICGTLAEAETNSGNYQDKLIDGTDLLERFPNCKYPNFTDTNCGSVYGPKLRASLITRMLAAAEKNGVKIKPVMFMNAQLLGSEFISSSFNQDNCWYNNASKCGPLASGDNFWDQGSWTAPLFSENTAINYAKRALKFWVQVWGDSPAIYNWEIYNEAMFAPPFLPQADRGNLALNEQVFGPMNNWVDSMAAYVKSIDTHNRPVSVSGWVKDTNNKKYEVTNRQYALPNIDHVQWHLYESAVDAVDLIGIFRNIESTYGKTLFIGEFWPWGGHNEPLDASANDPFIESSQRADPPHEGPPYRPTKGRLWTHLIATGSNVAHRWGEDGLDGLNRWEVHELYQPTGRFISAVNWKNWNFASSEPWENRITGNFQLYENGTVPFKVARGDGDQVMILFQGTQNSVPITVTQLPDGNDYTLRVFDYLTGNIINTRTNLTVTNGSLTQTIDVSALDRRVAVVLIEKASSATTSPTPTPDPNNQTIQLENCVLNGFPGITTPFTTTTVSGSTFISQSVSNFDPLISGSASCPVNLSKRGIYRATANVDAPDGNRNSFFINFDTNPLSPDMIWTIPVFTTGFETRDVTWQSTGNTVPHDFLLSPGTHNLILRGREADTRVDSLNIYLHQPLNIADFDFSGVVDQTDYGLMLNDFDKPNLQNTDLNQNSKTDLFDFGILVSNFMQL